MSNIKMCNFCIHCDTTRTNDFGQVRCKRFSTYVDIMSCCDYFLSEETKLLMDALDERADKEIEK